MAYIDPRTVRSPKSHWILIDVLYDGGEDDHSVAIGEWDGQRVLAMRWNGNTEEQPAGSPQSRGLATWFIMPGDYNEVLVESLPEGKRLLARSLLGLPPVSPAA